MTQKLEVGFQRTLEEIEFDIPTMAKMIEEAYLSEEKEDDGYNRKTFPPSGVGYGSGVCPRRWYYEFNSDVVRDDEVEILNRIAMDYGTESGERIAEQFKRSGILIDDEVDAISENPPIKGRIDLIVNWHDEETIGEVKTTKQEAFTLLKAAGIPKGYHLIQLLIYMKIRKAKQGFMLYENRNTGEILIMPVFMTGEYKRIVDEAFEWFEKVYQNKELPVRPFTKGSIECKYCPFKAHCWNPKEDSGTVTIGCLEVPES
jgi:CRISPR/Cas system-associated exonuclease Cas4 (RecB family)